MFGNKTKQPPIKSLIAQGTRIQGDLQFGEGLRIDGEVHGNIRAIEGEPSILIVSEVATVSGSIEADHVATSKARCWPASCSNCSPRPISRAMCRTVRSRCTRARALPASSSRWRPTAAPQCPH